MNKQPLVSIIVPVYNCAQYLEYAVKSALNQTYQNIEILLINNGSTDSSFFICEKLGEADPRIHALDVHDNVGAGEARNIGLDHARGDCIYFLDADDTLECNALERLVNEMIDKDVDVVICGHKAFVPGTSFVDHHVPQEQYLTTVEDVHIFASTWLPNGLIGFLWNKLYKASIIKDFAISFKALSRLEDGFFNIDYFNHCSSCAVITEELYNYRLSSSEEVIRKHNKEYFRLYCSLIDECNLKRDEWGTTDISKDVMYGLCLDEFGTCIENAYLSDWGQEKKRRIAFLNGIRDNTYYISAHESLQNLGKYRRILIQLLDGKHFAILGFIVRFKTFVKSNATNTYYKLK